METLLEFSKLAPRPQSGIVFNQYLSDLTGVMYRRLSTTVEEEVSCYETQDSTARHVTLLYAGNRVEAGVYIMAGVNVCTLR